MKRKICKFTLSRVLWDALDYPEQWLMVIRCRDLLVCPVLPAVVDQVETMELLDYLGRQAKKDRSVLEDLKASIPSTALLVH